MEKEIIHIKDSFITLSQLLKLTNHFESGGHIKTVIKEEGVLVNNELEHRRGRKLYDNDIVQLATKETFIVKAREENEEEMGT